MKEWQLSDEQVKALALCFAPELSPNGVWSVVRADVTAYGRVELRFRCDGVPYRAGGQVTIDKDRRELSMDKYRAEKAAKAAQDGRDDGGVG